MPEHKVEQQIAEVLRERILYIGGVDDAIPQVATNEGTQVYTGCPDDLIGELSQALASHASYLAEQIFFHVLLRGGDKNPFHSISAKWFVDVASPKIRELLTSDASHVPTPAPPQGNYVCNDDTFPTEVTFDNGRVVKIALREDDTPYLTISPKSEYPKPCGICAGVIQSKEDLDWHGYGNCRDIPEAIFREASAPPPAESDEGFGDPLYRHYQEYSSMVPPNGEPLMTYSGWLHRLSARLDREKNTPAQAAPLRKPEGK